MSIMVFKGTVSRDFILLVFFMNQFPPSPRVFHLDRFEFFRKFVEIFASQGAPPVSTTPVANLPPVSTTPVANISTIFASVVDTGGKFATGVNENFKKKTRSKKSRDTVPLGSFPNRYQIFYASMYSLFLRIKLRIPK
jgi:hypothetical protein